MTKIIVKPNHKEDTLVLIKEPIDGIILSINDLSINTNFSLDLSELKTLIPLIKQQKIEIFISLNKIMHNDDLKNLEMILIELDKLAIDKIMFYDLAVLTLSQKNNLTKELVIAQDHLNSSFYNLNYWMSKNINNTLIPAEITLKEIIEMKENSKMHLIVPLYGYIPVFYSRRYLISNYFEYIKKSKTSDLYYLYHEKDNDYYPIMEEKAGTGIYSGYILNGIEEYKELITNKIDYILLNGFNIQISQFIRVINDYKKATSNELLISNDNINKGFLFKETIYKVRKDER